MKNFPSLLKDVDHPTSSVECIIKNSISGYIVLEHYTKETKLNQNKRKQEEEKERTTAKSGDRAKNKIVERNVEL